MADYRPYGGPHGDDAAPGPGYRRWAPASPEPSPSTPKPVRWPEPPDRRPRRRLRLLGALVPVLALTSGATAMYHWAGQPGTENPAPEVGVSASANASPPAAVAHTAPSDVRFVQTGECLRNDGDLVRPQFTIAPCGPQTYEVLARFDGATDGESDAKRKCASVPGYTDWYFFKSELNVLDYVLCLRAR